jgi:excisionase family DNA binding protein
MIARRPNQRIEFWQVENGMQATQPPRAIGILRFCEMYGISRSKTYELLASGELESTKIGKRRLIPFDAAESWFQNARRESQAV